MNGILLVHAHPDDETIGTGATMAHYAAAGVPVTLVTCTLGEEGEIHLPELAQFAPEAADQLGGYRYTELAAACTALGVADHRFLGGAGRYRDSGMMGTPANEHPRCFWRADLEEAAGLLLEVIREVRPQVLVTYDPNGFYGHPDHIQAHRTAMRGAELAAAEGIGPAKIYWTAVPKSVLAAGIEEFAGSSENPFEGATHVDELPFGTPDEDIAARIDARASSQAKAAAIRAHASQIPADSWLNTMASGFGAAGEPNQELSGAAGEPNQELSGAAGEPNQELSGAAGEPNQELSGAAGEPNRELSGAAGEPNAKLSDAAGEPGQKSGGGDFMGVEYYVLAVGERGPGDGPDGWESDLFAGLARP